MLTLAVLLALAGVARAFITAALQGKGVGVADGDPLVSQSSPAPRWLLLVPPVATRPGEDPGTRPLDEWTPVQAHDSAEACEQARVELIGSALRVAKAMDADPNSAVAQRTWRHAVAASAARCVPSVPGRLVRPGRGDGFTGVRPLEAGHAMALVLIKRPAGIITPPAPAASAEWVQSAPLIP